MNISVMSPQCHNNGNTTVAALLASSMARQNTKVCLTHVREKSESLYPYYRIQNGGAASVDALQLAKLIRTGGMQKDSFTNYCKNIQENFDIFSLDAEYGQLSEAEISDVIRFISQGTPYDYVIFDVDENSLDKEVVKTAIEQSDVIILVITQAITEITRFKSMQQTIMSRTRKIPKIMVVNKYRNTLGTLKDMQKTLNLIGNPNYGDIVAWEMMHDNSYIVSCENKGELQYLADEIRKQNGEVLELGPDIQRVIKDILDTKRAIARRNAELRRAGNRNDDF